MNPYVNTQREPMGMDGQTDKRTNGRTDKYLLIYSGISSHSLRGVCIDCQGKSFNTNIAKVQAQKVFFWPLDDIELVDWTTTNKFARLWFCEDIHHSSILKLAIKKAIQKSANRNLSSKLFEVGGPVLKSVKKNCSKCHF